MKVTNPLTAVKPALRAGMRWTLWNPARALLVGGSVLMVIVLGTTAYLLSSANDFLVAANEKKAAIEAIKAAGRPTTATSTTTSTTTAAPSTSPTTAGTKPAPATSASVPVVAAPAAAASIDRAVRGFIAAWATAPTAASDGAWIRALSPWTDDSLLEMFRLTDRRQVPAGAKVTTVGSPVIVDNKARVTVQVANVGDLSITLNAFGSGWLVSELTPPDGHEQ